MDCLDDEHVMMEIDQQVCPGFNKTGAFFTKANKPIQIPIGCLIVAGLNNVCFNLYSLYEYLEHYLVNHGINVVEVQT